MEFKNESELFDYIWETRPHFSEISGKKLYEKDHPRWHWQFSHILVKGLYRLYKLNPDNISLVLPNEHVFYEHFTNKDRSAPLYKLYREKWDALFEKKAQLKREYHSGK